MNYQRIYDNIIQRGKTRILDGYKEKHHIIPRCLGGTDDEINLVSLTPEEHYLCHLLLVKMHPNNIRLVRAAMFMISANKDQQRNNKAYGWLKRQYSDYMRGPNNPQKLNPRSGERHHTYNRKIEFNFTDEGRKILADKMMGDKNPMSKVKPWNHPRATDYSKSVWKQADMIYQVWVENNTPSYCKLYTLVNDKCYTNDTKVIGPYMNMVKYFRKGWIPKQDNEWTQYK
jgi:hypothetical protein